MDIIIEQPLVPVFLTTTDAERFKLFQKHYELICTMEDKGVFNIGFGKAIFNFSNGVLQSIQREDVIWKKA